jgi:DNA-binding transcriptional ArsR family regulator
MKRVPHPLPAREALVMIAGFFSALADPMRIKLVHALMSGEKNVNALTEITGGMQPNVSRHLRKLTLAGVVNHEKRGTHVIYSIGEPTIYGLCEQVCGNLEKRFTQQAKVIGTAARR